MLKVIWLKLRIHKSFCNCVVDPIFPLSFLVNSWIPSILDTVFQVTFLTALLLYWLCIYHGVRQVCSCLFPLDLTNISVANSVFLFHYSLCLKEKKKLNFTGSRGNSCLHSVAQMWCCTRMACRNSLKINYWIISPKVKYNVVCADTASNVIVLRSKDNTRWPFVATSYFTVLLAAIQADSRSDLRLPVWHELCTGKFTADQ